MTERPRRRKPKPKSRPASLAEQTRACLARMPPPERENAFDRVCREAMTQYLAALAELRRRRQIVRTSLAAYAKWR